MNDLMHELSMADPLRHSPIEDERDRLARIWTAVEEQASARPGTSAGDRSGIGRASVGRGGGRSRRWIALGAAAAVLAVAGTAALSLVEPGNGPSLAVTSVALTEDGRLACTPPTSVSEPIDPADAAAPMLPTWLPEGWQVRSVSAVRESSPTCFSNPSLVLADADGDGMVTRSAMVYGPIDEPISVEGRDAVEVPIAGTTGQLFRTSTNDKLDQQWLWTDARDRSWLMRTYGYSDKAGGRVAEALTVEGDRIGVDESAVPEGTAVVFQRTGTPYPAWTEQTRTSVSLGHPATTGEDAEVLLEVVASTTPDTFGTDLVVPEENRIVRTEDDVIVESEMLGVFRGAVVAPGVFAYLMNTTQGSMTADQRREVVASLAPVSADGR